MDHPRFGGDWTTAKLGVLAKYLECYTKALKNKPSKSHPFRKAYIDAFAGTGYRDAPSEDEGGKLMEPLLFPDLAEQEPQELLEGSARLALRGEPRFDRYVFIDRSPSRCAQLDALKTEFPHLAQDIQIRNGDANAEVQTMCEGDWSARRAVLFLDPYGMQVEWKTIEAIAATKAIRPLVALSARHSCEPLADQVRQNPRAVASEIKPPVGHREVVRGILQG